MHMEDYLNIYIFRCEHFKMYVVAANAVNLGFNYNKSISLSYTCYVSVLASILYLHLCFAERSMFMESATTKITFAKNFM